METLESIADKLLEENGISVVEAEKISKEMKFLKLNLSLKD
jgi:hypothetical protein